MGFLPTVILTSGLLSISIPVASAFIDIPHMASSTTLITSEAWAAAMTGAPTSFTSSIYSIVLSEHPFSEVFIVTKILIDRWSVYGCKLSVKNRPHSNPIVIMGIIVPMITIRTHVHALHHLSQLAHLLSHCLLELLEFGFPMSLSVTIRVVRGIVTVALIGHD
jgi:hypothetical protein